MLHVALAATIVAVPIWPMEQRAEPEPEPVPEPEQVTAQALCHMN